MKHLLLTTIAAVLLVGCRPPPKDISEAARIGDIKAVKQFIAAGVDVNAVCEAGPSNRFPLPPLHAAAAGDTSGKIRGQKEIVELLIAAGADVNAKDSRRWTPLHYAATFSHKEIAELLLAEGADVNAKDIWDKTPLDWTEVESPNASTDRKAGQKETADFLRKHGGKSGAEDSIHVAAELGSIEAVKQHLAAAADVNAKTESGWTPLHEAARSGRKEIAELLIDTGADVNAKNRGGQTPFDLAGEVYDWHSPEVKANHIETVLLLRKHGGKTGEELKAEGK